MKFFRYFPQITYAFINGNTTAQWVLTNPVAKLVIVEKLQQHVTAYYDYIVQDDERPDTVALRVYGSPDYTWLVLLVNGIQSLYDWPLSHDEFNDYIIERYGSITAAQASPVYKTTEGFVVDADSYQELPVARQGTISDAYQEELTQNEARRTIKVLPAEFVAPLTAELKRAFVNG